MLKKLLPLLALVAMPALAKPVLTVYTYDSFSADWGPGPAVKKAFEAECGCELKFVALEDGVSLLNRLRMEGKNSKADVVLGLDNNLLEAAAQSKLFAKSNVPASAVSVPGGWDNDTFVPYDYGYFAFVYDKNKLANPPKSLKELVEGPQKWRVIYEDPRTSTPGLGLLLWMQKVYGDQAPEAWQKLAAKTVTVTKGWSEAYGLFLKGESDLVLSYTTSPAYHMIEEKKDNYAAASFAEGHYLQVEVAARTAASKQPLRSNGCMTDPLTLTARPLCTTRSACSPSLSWPPAALQWPAPRWPRPPTPTTPSKSSWPCQPAAAWT